MWVPAIQEYIELMFCFVANHGHIFIYRQVEYLLTTMVGGVTYESDENVH